MGTFVFEISDFPILINCSHCYHMERTIQVYGFTSNTTEETVKEFLERCAGEGTVSTVRIRVPGKRGARLSATVQFTTNAYADIIISLANKELMFEGFSLKARQVETDMDEAPRSYWHAMEHVTLNLGCQTSKEKFSVLWKKGNVRVEFGFEMRKIYFFLTYNRTKYKLELLYETIWQLQLHKSSRQRAKFLVIQVFSVL